jgi:hypothetical protein
MNEAWNRWTAGWPPAAKRWVGRGLSILAGLLAAVVLHYVLYRIGLPSKPFIYVAF